MNTKLEFVSRVVTPKGKETVVVQELTCLICDGNNFHVEKIGTDQGMFHLHFVCANPICGDEYCPDDACPRK